MIDHREKIAIFIDGVNLFAASKQIEFNIDYNRLLVFFREQAYVLRASYYTVIAENPDDSTVTIKPLLDWLDYNGYRVVTKKVKEYVDSIGRKKLKGSIDIDFSVDCLEYAKHVDHLVLFTGNGDFKSLIEALQRMGKKVTVVSTIDEDSKSGGYSVVSDDLRRIADHFIDLNSIRDQVQKEI
jgi:uncharacterized LabA/DUF88 family protein